MATRERLDVLVWQRGLAPSRAKARALILAGQIAVNGERTTRAGTPVDLQATVTRLGAASPYVSRGGEKLAAALEAFDLTVQGRVAMDVWPAPLAPAYGPTCQRVRAHQRPLSPA
jgi:23S rRNA (cytidine1920-2'-O)/16S rRNA (cytidine1409-2'-O)-methyltransferase